MLQAVTEEKPMDPKPDRFNPLVLHWLWGLRHPLADFVVTGAVSLRCGSGNAFIFQQAEQRAEKHFKRLSARLHPLHSRPDGSNTYLARRKAKVLARSVIQIDNRSYSPN
jgi:hypothetical protein